MNEFLLFREDIQFGCPKDGDYVKASGTVRLRHWQCNTKATLLPALCKAAGIPARIHFSLISKDIQKGFFRGLSRWLKQWRFWRGNSIHQSQIPGVC
ncbi:transglutaminase domain-containing protein [Yoonia sp. R2-816]|uniref:transglutaminase domain-containing protein n=1 Tax=Yoonia sp. R2-816 TaxID=3342638 RepID=UPI00372A133F